MMVSLFALILLTLVSFISRQRRLPFYRRFGFFFFRVEYRLESSWPLPRWRGGYWRYLDGSVGRLSAPLPFEFAIVGDWRPWVRTPEGYHLPAMMVLVGERLLIGLIWRRHRVLPRPLVRWFVEEPGLTVRA